MEAFNDPTTNNDAPSNGTTSEKKPRAKRKDAGMPRGPRKAGAKRKGKATSITEMSLDEIAQAKQALVDEQKSVLEDIAKRSEAIDAEIARRKALLAAF